MACSFIFFSVKILHGGDVGILGNENLVCKISKEPLDLGSWNLQAISNFYKYLIKLCPLFRLKYFSIGKFC